MKTITLALCAAFTFCSLAVAQQPVQPVPSNLRQPVAENYVVLLTMTDKDKKATELSLVVASNVFKTDFMDSQSNITTFSGTLAPEEGDAIFITYALGSSIRVSVPPDNNSQFKNIVTQATVHLKLGEPVQILKSDTLTCSLSISRLSDQQAKGKQL